MARSESVWASIRESRSFAVAALLAAFLAGGLAAAAPKKEPELSDPQLQTRVAIRGKYQQLSAALDSVEQRALISLAASPSVPPRSLFLANSNGTTAEMVRQLRRLLTDEDWTYQWATRDLGDGLRQYLL